MSSVPVKSVVSQDNEIITAVPVFTIDNTKQTIILKAKKEGKTSITISFPDGKEVIKAEVKMTGQYFPKMISLNICFWINPVISLLRYFLRLK